MAAVVERPAEHRAGDRDSWPARCSSAPMSATEARPPAAITGMETASAIRPNTSTLKPEHGAVAVDVGIDHRGNAGVLEAPCDIEHGQLRASAQPCNGDHAVARIETHGDAPRTISAAALTRAGSRTAAVPMMTRADAFAESSLRRLRDRECRRRAEPESHRRQDALDRSSVHRLARKGAVKVDDVQIFEALCREGPRLLGRIAMKTVARAMSPCSRRTASPFSDRWRKKNHGFHVRKFGNQRKPEFLGFLRMKLRTDNVVAADDRGERPAIFGFRHQIGACATFNA